MITLQVVRTDSGAHLDSSSMGTGGSLLGLKRLEREVDHSSPTVAVVKNTYVYIHPLPRTSYGVVLS
jgi:hypothetical protein